MNRATMTGILWMGVSLGLVTSARAQTTQPALPAAPPSAAAPTTQPVEAPWPRTVGQFAKALRNGDRTQLASILSETANFRSFTPPAAGQTPGLEDALSLCKEARLIGTHAYQQAPLSMAADLAADFKRAEDLPELVWRRMIPQEVAQMTRANATAAEWIEGSFDVKVSDWNGTPVAVLAFWREGHEDPKLVFVLLRGQQDSLGIFHVTAAMYGDPLPTPSK